MYAWKRLNSQHSLNEISKVGSEEDFVWKTTSEIRQILTLYESVSNNSIQVYQIIKLEVLKG